MTAFIPGQAVEKNLPECHVRGRVVAYQGMGYIKVEVEEILRGLFLDIDLAANWQPYDPQKAQLDAAEADAATDALRDLLREAAEALAASDVCLVELVAVVRGECPSLLDEDSGGNPRLSFAIDWAMPNARAVLAKIEEALK